MLLLVIIVQLLYTARESTEEWPANPTILIKSLDTKSIETTRNPLDEEEVTIEETAATPDR